MNKRKNVRYVTIIIMVTMLMELMLSTVYAYELNGAYITSTLIFTPYEGFGETSRDHMSLAAAEWSAEVGDFTLIEVTDDTHSSATGYATRDQNNYIYRVDAGAGYVAQASSWKTSAGRVVECDINLNMYYPWANEAQSNCFDVYTIILHEMGHPLGLGDLDDSELYDYDTAVMWYASRRNSTKRTLRTDDQNGIAELYG